MNSALRCILDAIDRCIYRCRYKLNTINGQGLGIPEIDRLDGGAEIQVLT